MLRAPMVILQALMGGGIKTRKTDNAVTGVNLRATNLAKPLKVKGKGKGAAKPAQIAAQIEANLSYPGQIRVTVIRETRCVEVAK